MREQNSKENETYEGETSPSMFLKEGNFVVGEIVFRIELRRGKKHDADDEFVDFFLSQDDLFYDD